MSYVVWGRNLVRERWRTASHEGSLEKAHVIARELAVDPRAWHYTVVKPEGVNPRKRDREDYCQWTLPVAKKVGE